jgi:hypothetical protein
MENFQYWPHFLVTHPYPTLATLIPFQPSNPIVIAKQSNLYFSVLTIFFTLFPGIDLLYPSISQVNYFQDLVQNFLPKCLLHQIRVLLTQSRLVTAQVVG